MHGCHVPPVAVRTKPEVAQAISLDWQALFPWGSRRHAAREIGASDGKVIARTIDGSNSLPELHTALNSLTKSEAALFHTFALFGGTFVRTKGIPSADAETLGQMLHAAAEYHDRLKDGHRCHQDTAALARLFVPLVPALLAVIEEAKAL
jgi:hypothetical protein